MIILDTNVVSALMRFPADSVVVAWLDRQPASSIWITVVTLYEIRTGIGLLPAGSRRNALEDAFDRLLFAALDQRILDFDRSAALAASALTTQRKLQGRTVGLADTQIAGIATARRAAIATRNIRHFSDVDVPVIDPWN